MIDKSRCPICQTGHVEIRLLEAMRDFLEDVAHQATRKAIYELQERLEAAESRLAELEARG